MTSGVYYIRNCYTNRLYIGQSSAVRGRFAQHLYLLERDQHSNSALQRDWNDFGSAAFTCGEIVSEHNRELRCQLEQTFIRIYQTNDPRLGYNTKRQKRVQQ